jgi:hypothetical protein
MPKDTVIYTNDANLPVGGVAFVQYPHDRDEIPNNILNRKDIELVRIEMQPTRKEPRYFVWSLWRQIYFHVSPELFSKEDLFSQIMNPPQA